MFNHLKLNNHSGKVLSSFSILKYDASDILHNINEIPIMDGAPNFFYDENVCSVGQPSMTGLEGIMKSAEKKKLVWINLREEPVIYINDGPYVLREKDFPFNNISSFTGIFAKNIENLEERLKEDIQLEIDLNKGFIRVFEEDCDNKMVAKHLFVKRLKTSVEVYYYLKSKGYKIKYYRVPLPSSDFLIDSENINEIINILQKHDISFSTFLFSSSSGRARSVFVLVIARLFYMSQVEKEKIISKFYKKKSSLKGINRDKDYVFEMIKDKKGILKNIADKWLGSEDELYSILNLSLEGKYRVIYNIMGLIDKKSKIVVDYLLDKYSYFLNIKNKILWSYLDFLEDKSLEKQKIVAYSLERYCMLILLAEFFFNRDDEGKIDFISWINANGVFSNLFLYLKNFNHIDKSLFPLNLLNNEVNYKLNCERYLKGKYTMLFEDETKISKSCDEKIHILKFPTNDAADSILINLREEPCIYIDNRLFVLKEMINYYSEPTCLSGISSEDLVKLEFRIKDSLIRELEKNNKLLLFKYSSGDIKDFYMENITPLVILTPEEYFASKNFKNVKYLRYPVTPKLPFKLEAFDFIKNTSLSYKSGIFFIQSSSDVYRPFYSLIIIDLSLSLSKKTSKEIVKIKPITDIIRILDHGQESYESINYLYFKYFGIKFKLLNEKFNDRKSIIANIRKIILLICFASYCRKNKGESFCEFFRSRNDIVNIYNSIELYPTTEIFFEVESELLEDYEFIKNRNGKVLSSMTVLKNDYFVGSHVYFFEEEEDSVHNFRYVHDYQRTYVGLAMPTKDSVSKTIELLKKDPKVDVSKTLWFCLREEPVIYVDDHPFALMYITNPCENIETRGISFDTIEKVEEDLLKDTLNEIKDGELLVHDEIQIDGKIKTVGELKNVTKVETVRQLFNNFDFKFYRVPITDEKHPLPSDFDIFYTLITKNGDFGTFIFNCQMGRGRTTSFMIIGYLIHNHALVDVKSITFLPAKYKLIARLLQILPNSVKSKKLLDYACDKFSHLQNLRECISQYSVGDFYVLRKGKNFILRYFYLLVFTEYIVSMPTISFSLYLKRHPEINSLADKIDIIGLETVAET